jgi:hypothetical protein
MMKLYGPPNITHIYHDQRLYRPDNGVLEVEPHLAPHFAPFGFSQTAPAPEKEPEKKGKGKAEKE